MAAIPVAVEVWRGGRIEYRHRAWLCVADPVSPRSAVKTFPPLGLIESGAADAGGVRKAEIAPACPAQAAAAVIRAGIDLRGTHDNCLSEPADMLAAASQLGASVAGNGLPEHAVQLHCATAAWAYPDRLPEPGIDGWRPPNHPLPLRGLARAVADSADPALLAGSGRGGTLKVEDGATSAAVPAPLAVPARLGAHEDPVPEVPVRLRALRLHDTARAPVGWARPAAVWPGP